MYELEVWLEFRREHYRSVFTVPPIWFVSASVRASVLDSDVLVTVGAVDGAAVFTVPPIWFVGASVGASVLVSDVLVTFVAVDGAAVFAVHPIMINGATAGDSVSLADLDRMCAVGG